MTTYCEICGRELDDDYDVIICEGCGVRMCAHCANEYDDHYCNDCYKEYVNEKDRDVDYYRHVGLM